MAYKGDPYHPMAYITPISPTFIFYFPILDFYIVWIIFVKNLITKESFVISANFEVRPEGLFAQTCRTSKLSFFRKSTTYVP